MLKDLHGVGVGGKGGSGGPGEGHPYSAPHIPGTWGPITARLVAPPQRAGCRGEEIFMGHASCPYSYGLGSQMTKQRLREKKGAP